MGYKEIIILIILPLSIYAIVESFKIIKINKEKGGIGLSVSVFYKYFSILIPIPFFLYLLIRYGYKK